MTPTTRTKLSADDQVRLDLFVLRLEWHLEGWLGGRDRKSAVRTLREGVAADPRGVRTALRELGPPAVLASRYSDDGPARPLWSVGVVTAAASLVVWWALFLSFTGGMLAAVGDLAASEATSTFAFVGVTAFSGQDGFGISWTSGTAWILVPFCIALVAFTLGSRAWRLVRLRGARAHGRTAPVD